MVNLERSNSFGLAFGIVTILGSIIIVLALNASIWVILYGILLSIPFFLAGLNVLERNHVYFVIGGSMIAYAVYEYAVGQISVTSTFLIALSGIIAIALGMRQ